MEVVILNVCFGVIAKQKLPIRDALGCKLHPRANSAKFLDKWSSLTIREVTKMKWNVAVLGILLVGCASPPPLKQEFSFSNTSAEAFDCAIFAARDVGLSIRSSDPVSGILYADKVDLTAGGLLGASEQSFNIAVDKQLKVVSVRAEGVDAWGIDQSSKMRKFVDEFQSSFKKRCAAASSSAVVAPPAAPLPSMADQSRKPNSPKPAPRADTAREKMTIDEVQTKLIGLGYLKGKADGMIGKNTTDALRRFQKENGIAVTGKPDSDTISRLRTAKAN